MDHSSEQSQPSSSPQPEFKVKLVIEQKPFKIPAVQGFFTEWCKANDDIVSQIVTRDKWNKIIEGNGSILTEDPESSNGRKILTLPEDLQLWEMLGVIEAIDTDTFGTDSNRGKEKKEELRHLGKLLKNSGIYIAQRLELVTDGREIAQALALELYEYGLSLETGERSSAPKTLEEIASQSITPEETIEIDRFLAGEELYASRQARVNNKIESMPNITEEDRLSLYETERTKTLSQFFRVSALAFKLRQKPEDFWKPEVRDPQNLPKPWQTYIPVHDAFISKIEQALKGEIETPQSELISSIFRRGMELLRAHMPFDKLPRSLKEAYLKWNNGEKTLREALEVDRLKAELTAIRKSGNKEQTSIKEREIAGIIQRAVSRFPYKSKTSNPTEMIAQQFINCVGASTLGGALMEEVGLNYLVGDVPEHSILFLITVDGSVEWLDMLNGRSNDDESLTDEMIDGKKHDGSPLTVSDIVSFSQNPNSKRSLTFDIKNSPMYQRNLPWVTEGQRQYVKLFQPVYGQQIQVLNNMGIAFGDLGHYEEAIEVYQQAIVLNPQNAEVYNNMGNALNALGHYQEAIEVYQQAIVLNPQNAEVYNNMGAALNALGRNQEAIDACQKFIELADENKYSDQIKIIKQIILELEKKIKYLTFSDVIGRLILKEKGE